ncbi:MAG: ABC transporter ATP-binding protein [Alphaproteobacteria bacterium]|nr:ABC transporter ATP-binding protein [Alphaproteobacteria bacterium]
MWPYVKPYSLRAALAVLVTIPIGSFDALTAWILKPYMDVVLVEKQVAAVSLMPLVILIGSAFQSICNYTATYFNTWVGQKITMSLKMDLYRKLLYKEASYFDHTSSGDIILQFSTCAEMACSGLLANVKLFTTRFFSSVSLVCVLFWNSWQLAIIALIFMFGALYPLTMVRKKIKALTKKQIGGLSAITTHYNETFAGNRIIASYNLHQHEEERFLKDLKGLFHLQMKMIQKTGGLSPLIHFIVSLGIAGAIWLGSWLIVTHQITSGNFVSFIAALLMLYTPIKGIGNSFTSVQMSFLMMDQVFNQLNSIPNIRNSETPVPLKGVHNKIEYKNVVFEYLPGKPVLKGVSANIEIGKMYAFVGNSGGGKTTFVNLLPRFYDITGGELLIDGIPVKEINLHDLRENIAIVFQDNFLFSGTIRDNILLGKTDYNEEQLQIAVKSACLDEFIASLENGLDTQIGERGVLLSGGQKQRVAIARAFMKNAPIVILDEATSALDNKSEAIVQQAIDNLMKDRTVLVIAHRLSTVKNADKIFVINEGIIVESGTHEELLKIGGEYAALYEMQFKKKKEDIA